MLPRHVGLWICRSRYTRCSGASNWGACTANIADNTASARSGFNFAWFVFLFGFIAHLFRFVLCILRVALRGVDKKELSGLCCVRVYIHVHVHFCACTRGCACVCVFVSERVCAYSLRIKYVYFELSTSCICVCFTHLSSSEILCQNFMIFQIGIEKLFGIARSNKSIPGKRLKKKKKILSPWLTHVIRAEWNIGIDIPIAHRINYKCALK